MTTKHRWDEASNQQLDFLDIGIGNGSVRDYTAIGTAVNLASAFETAARDGKQILCDQLTYRNVQDLVSKVEPEDFVLQKPGQEIGVRYKCYTLSELSSKDQARVFISHSQYDRPHVEALIKQLNDLGVQTWYSASDIKKGALWTAEVRKAIAQCNWMAVIVSKHSANSKWIRREVDLALAAQHLEDRIIPVVLDGTELWHVNDYLRSMQAVVQTSNEEIATALANRFVED